MVYSVDGKIALITGAASGFGLNLAKSLCGKGSKAVLCDMGDAAGLALAAELNARHGPGTAVYKHCDVADMEQFQGVFDFIVATFGRLDICVNNAGIGGDTPFEKDSKHRWKKVIDIDLTAVIHGTQLAVGLMEKSGGGVIVNVASEAGFFSASAMPVYCAAKHGVIGFTRSMGALADSHNIRVNAFAPSFVVTGLTQAAARDPRFKSFMEASGYNSMDDSIRALTVCIEDDKLAGQVVRLNPLNGIHVHNDFKHTPAQYFQRIKEMAELKAAGSAANSKL